MREDDYDLKQASESAAFKLSTNMEFLKDRPHYATMYAAEATCGLLMALIREVRSLRHEIAADKGRDLID